MEARGHDPGPGPIAPRDLGIPSTGTPERRKGKPESELRVAARRHGLTLKELAARMGVSYGYLSQVSAGRRPWSTMLRERAMAVLGEVPGQGVVYRQGGPVKGESSYIRERARELGMSLMELADQVGVSYGYMTQVVSRGRRNMSPTVQAQVEAALDAPAKVEPAQPRSVDPRALWDRMDAHGFSQNEVGPAGRHQLRSSLPDHERPSNSVGARSGEAPRGPVPANGGGAGGARRGQGDGLEEG